VQFKGKVWQFHPTGDRDIYEGDVPDDIGIELLKFVKRKDEYVKVASAVIESSAEEAPAPAPAVEPAAAPKASSTISYEKNPRIKR